MQNKMQITGKWSRSEPEVEFQYGGCDVYVGGKVRVSEFMIFLTLQHWGSK